MRNLLIAIVGLGLLVTPAAAQGDLVKVTFTTTPAGGNYAPRNIVAVWIENAGGGFVKTIGRWANTRKQHLVAWSAASGQDADAVSGATRSTHTGSLTVTWDLTDRAGAEVPDGTYTVRMETADANANTAAQNNQGTFSVSKNGQSSTETTAGGGFNAVTIEYAVGSASCNNGAIDEGETCDPPGSCPTSCAASGDACMPNDLVGSAAGCTSECVVSAITACADGDGCCAAGCDEGSDSDCGSGGGGGGGPVTGGCATGGGGSGAGAVVVAWLLLGLGAIGRRRR
jgi:MYXO-CTERM domain-containing protein